MFKIILYDLIFLIVFNFILIKATEYCIKSDNVNECAAENNKYDIETNLFLKDYKQALENYVPCTQANCSCHTSTIEKDLSFFKSGITKEMIDSVRGKGVLYQIIDRKIYREKECMFSARCNGNEHFIKALLPELSNDMELVINCRDWPQISAYHGGPKGPVFSFSKTKEYAGIC